MKLANFPIVCGATPAAAARLGPALERVAIAAFKAMIKRHGRLEIAHQQISYLGHDLAFSSRISGAGDLIIEFDVGDPNLANRIVFEDDLRQAHRNIRGIRSSRRER